MRQGPGEWPRRASLEAQSSRYGEAQVRGLVLKDIAKPIPQFPIKLFPNVRLTAVRHMFNEVLNIAQMSSNTAGRRPQECDRQAEQRPPQGLEREDHCARARVEWVRLPLAHLSSGYGRRLPSSSSGGLRRLFSQCRTFMNHPLRMDQARAR